MDSVINQTFMDWELIVVDDNSKDSIERKNTETTMKPYLSNKKIRYIKHDYNKGGSAARNTGIKCSEGEYIAFLDDDDDEWLPEKLALQLKKFREVDQDTAALYTGRRIIDKFRSTTRDVIPEYKGNLLKQFLNKNVIGTTSAIMIRKDALVEVGMFDEELPARQDLDLYLRLSRHYNFDYVKLPLVIYNKHGKEKISNNLYSIIAAREIFYKKHYYLYKINRKSHSLYLQNMGSLYMLKQDLIQSRVKFSHAIKTNPYCLKSYLYFLLTYSKMTYLIYRKIRPSSL